MEIIIFYTFVIALISAFLILLMRKWGIVEIMQIHAVKIISELFSCDFCLSFWTNVFVAIIFALATGEYIILLLPLLATTLTRKLI